MLPSVGIHKHFRMIALQKSVLDMTGVTIPFEELWERMEDLYDLDELDDMVSPALETYSLLFRISNVDKGNLYVTRNSLMSRYHSHLHDHFLLFYERLLIDHLIHLHLPHPPQSSNAIVNHLINQKESHNHHLYRQLQPLRTVDRTGRSRSKMTEQQSLRLRKFKREEGRNLVIPSKENHLQLILQNVLFNLV